MTITRERPPARTGGRSTIRRAGEIETHHTLAGYPKGTFDRWAAYRDRVHGVPAERLRYAIESEREAAAWWLSDDLRLATFDEIVEAGLIDADRLAVKL